MATILVEQTHDGRCTGAPVRDDACPICGDYHDALWAIRRVLVETFGHFPVYRINGQLVPVDGTLPHVVARIPRGARRLSREDAHRYWKSDGYAITA